MGDSNEPVVDQSITQAEESDATSTIADLSDYAKLLLIGETGSGKSTFINYLTNYFGEGTLNTLKVAIPSRHYPVQTEGLPHNESNSNRAQESQTQSCRQYIFKDKNTNKHYIFIDTPGLGDTRGLDQDEININKIQEAVLDLGSLTGVIITMNGTNVRMNSSMKIVLALLARSLPDTVMQNIILVLTNTTDYSFNFDPSVLPLSGTTICAYTMENSAFSRPPGNRNTRIMQNLEHEWADSMTEIKAILKQVDAFTQVTVTALQEMKEIRDAIRNKTHNVMLQIHELQRIQISLDAYEKNSEKYEKEKTSFKDFLQIEIVKRKVLVPSAYRNMLCTSCHFVCHENCQLHEIGLAGDQLFIQCDVISRSTNQCSKCPQNCSFSTHYHSNHTIEEIECNRERVLTDIKELHDKADENLRTTQKHLDTINATKAILDESLGEACDTMTDMCKRLKRICKGFNLAAELSIVIEQMQAKLLHLTSVEAHAKMKETITNMCVFCDRMLEDQEKTKTHVPLKVIYRSREIEEAASAPFKQPSKEDHNEVIKKIHGLIITPADLHSKPGPKPNTSTPKASPPDPEQSSVTPKSAVTTTLNCPDSTYQDENSDDSHDTFTYFEIDPYVGETDSIYMYNVATGLSRYEMANRLSRCGPLRPYIKNGLMIGPSIYIDYRKSIAKVTFSENWSVPEAIRRFDNKSFGFKNAPIVTVVPSIPSSKG